MMGQKPPRVRDFCVLRARALAKFNGVPAQIVWPGQTPPTDKPPPSWGQIREWLEPPLPASDRCVDRLHAAVSAMCSSVPAANAIPYDPAVRISTAIASLRAELPILIAAAGQSSRGRGAYLALSDLLTRAEIAAHFVPETTRRQKHVHWHDDALTLLAILEDEAGGPVSVSAAGDFAGPGCQFLQSALNYVWDLARPLTAGNIAKAVRDARKRNW